MLLLSLSVLADYGIICPMRAIKKWAIWAPVLWYFWPTFWLLLTFTYWDGS